MEWPLLRGLPDGDREKVLSLARRKRYARNEIVFHEEDPGDTLHLIAKGRLAVKATTPRGDVATLAVLGPGEFFGEMALVSPEPPTRSATVVALEPAETLALHRDDIERIRREYVDVDRVIVEALTAQIRRLTGHLMEALFLPAPKRVFRRLLALIDLYAPGDVPAVIPLSQEDLASLAGTTRPTVNTILRSAESSGVIKLGRGRIEILRPDELERRAR